MIIAGKGPLKRSAEINTKVSVETTHAAGGSPEELEAKFNQFDLKAAGMPGDGSEKPPPDPPGLAERMEQKVREEEGQSWRFTT